MNRLARASALLARQSLESAVYEYWSVREGGVARCSFRAQLICLGEFLANPRLAEEASQVWWLLTRACHHHPYELAPTYNELQNWQATVERVIEYLSSSSG